MFMEIFPSRTIWKIFFVYKKFVCFSQTFAGQQKHSKLIKMFCSCFVCRWKFYASLVLMLRKIPSFLSWISSLNIESEFPWLQNLKSLWNFLHYLLKTFSNWPASYTNETVINNFEDIKRLVCLFCIYPSCLQLIFLSFIQIFKVARYFYCCCHARYHFQFNVHADMEKQLWSGKCNDVEWHKMSRLDSISSLKRKLSYQLFFIATKGKTLKMFALIFLKHEWNWQQESNWGWLWKMIRKLRI